jgi:hypothetical protein
MDLPRLYNGSATPGLTSLFSSVNVGHPSFSFAFSAAPSSFFSHHNMAEKSETSGVAPEASAMQPALPLLTRAVSRIWTSPLRSSPLRETAHSEPTSAIERMTLSDQGEEPRAASDAGKQSKSPSLYIFQLRLASMVGVSILLLQVLIQAVV